MKVLKFLAKFFGHVFKLSKSFFYMVFDIGPDWSFYRFISFADKYGKSESRPDISKIPASLTLSREFVKEIDYLKKLTDGDGLERGVSFYVADGDLVHGKIIKGTKSNVRFSEKVSLKYTFREPYFEKNIELNGENIFTKLVEKKNIPQKPKIFYLMRVHTHPPHFSGSQKFFALFSEQDIISFLGSKDNFTGLMTDKFWMLVKTNYSKKSLNSEVRELFEKSRKVSSLAEYEKTIFEILKRLNLMIFEQVSEYKLIRN